MFADSASPYVKGAYLVQAYHGWIAACFFSARVRDKSPERQAARVLEDAIRAQSPTMAVFFLRVRSSRRSGKPVAPDIEKMFWSWLADKGISDRPVV